MFNTQELTPKPLVVTSSEPNDYDLRFFTTTTLSDTANGRDVDTDGWTTTLYYYANLYLGNKKVLRVGGWRSQYKDDLDEFWFNMYLLSQKYMSIVNMVQTYREQPINERGLFEKSFSCHVFTAKHLMQHPTLLNLQQEIINAATISSTLYESGPLEYTMVLKPLSANTTPT